MVESALLSAALQFDGQVPDGRGGWVARFRAMELQHHLVAFAVGIAISIAILAMIGWWFSRTMK